MNLKELLIALGIDEPAKIPNMTKEKLEMQVEIDSGLDVNGISFDYNLNTIFIETL